MEEWPKSWESLASPSFVTGEMMGSNARLVFGSSEYSCLMVSISSEKLQKRSCPETEAEQDWTDFTGVANTWRSKWRIGENWLQTRKRSPIQPWNLRPWQSTQMECFPTPYPFSSSEIYSINHSPLCLAFQISQLSSFSSVVLSLSPFPLQQLPAGLLTAVFPILIQLSSQQLFPF